MATSNKIGNVWGETFFASLAIQSGSEIQLAGKITPSSLVINRGAKDFDPLHLANGGNLEKIIPEPPSEITMNAYVLYAGNGDVSAATSLAGLHDLFFGTEDATEFIIIDDTRTRNRFRLTILFTNDTSVTSAIGQVASGNDALRLGFADGFITKLDETMEDDGAFRIAFTFKVVPFDSAGTSNIRVQSIDSGDTGNLTAFSAYTSSTKF